MRRSLDFRGGLTSLFGDILLVALLSTLTAGIYMPWGVARLRRKILSLTYAGDTAIEFDGTGGQLFVVLLKALFFSVITLGIYGLLCFPIVAMLRWDAEHTIYPGGRRGEYRGTALDFFGQILLIGLLSAITAGIYGFWGYARIRRHILGNTFVSGQPLEFTGTGGQYLGLFLGNWLLSMVTFGIYGLLGCATVRELRWDAENTMLYMAPVMAPTPYPYDDRPYQVNVTVNR